MLSHPCQTLQKYTTFGGSDTHPETFSEGPSNIVTEDFTCPLCLVKCASFKGLRYHLCSSHDLFNFEFWVNEEYQAVNVSVRSDMWRSEIVANGVDPKQQTFFFCSKPLRRRKRQDLVQNSKYAHPLVLDSDFPTSTNGLNDKINGNDDPLYSLDYSVCC
ncbi:polycomb group protein embryonic flower 2 [Nicotiana attenuata]|uniref:Polycomb group protein embryonic flower 2 n=1 Tax=Nicotiana attenuata TaxID=49451 RepID=A0A314L1P6_NICAT|nr:polycomb group protein embryonic flower 2 [Nicotiana attenuata]